MLTHTDRGRWIIQQTLTRLPFFPLTPVNLTSSPSPLTNYAILCKSLISFNTLTKLSCSCAQWGLTNIYIQNRYIQYILPTTCKCMKVKPESFPDFSFKGWGLPTRVCVLWTLGQKYITRLSLLFPAVSVRGAHKELYYDSRCKPDSIQTLI